VQRIDKFVADRSASLNITIADCEEAVRLTFAEERNLSHRSDLEDFAREQQMVLTAVTRVSASVEPRSREGRSDRKNGAPASP
jgi:hypothetical protein